ncbi:MAG TPA: carboxypeptidase regulatory-like domain-containing protein [Pyrinomonadaceae bacterium]|jgi:hypothetical protein
MNSVKRIVARGLALALALALTAAVGLAQQAGSLRGQVTDEFGGALVGATVTVVSSSGAEKSAVTNDEGSFAVAGLAPGAYTVRVASTGFAPYEAADVQVAAGRSEPLDIKLSVTIEEQKVTVSTDQRGVSTESENNADAIVLRGKDLDALPDDPEDMAAALNALAGPSVGPNGGQIYIDGFTGGRMPPKEAIREVRVSQNPLNAENDRPGFGRIDILTRPGFGKITGSASYGFQDESMNARNPFAPSRAAFQQRLVNFTLGGPIAAKKSSFFLDFQRREEDDNDIINAFVLDPSLNTVRVNEVIFQPRRLTTFSPRFDYAFNQNHTLTLRYTFSRTTLENSAVGNFQLESRGFPTESTQHTFQVTETAVINPKVINETRFQFIRDSNEQNDTNTLPATIVNDSFTGGGAQVGLSFSRASRWELQNYLTATWLPNHTFRFGARLRGVRLTDVSRNNFGGTFFFSTLENFRRVVAGVPGAIPTQFSIAGGEPEATVSQVDLGAFFQDEWRIRPNLTLTLGLRYETQTNISSKFNLAPRLFFAWAPGGTSTGTLGQFGAGQPKFVIRGGGGIFYDRFNESGTLNANRFNSVDQQRFNIANTDLGADGRPILESLLAGVVYNSDGTITNAPTIDALVGLGQPQVVNRVDPNLEAPYSMLAAINVERQLPYNFTVFGVLFTYRTRHALVFRDANAPLPGTLERPDPNFGNVFQWESAGTFNDLRLQVGVRNQINRAFSIFANYVTGKAQSNTDCVFGNQFACYPSNSYDLDSDYGRVAFFPRHSFFFGGTLGIPKLNIALNPFIIARTGQFFNITTGRDTNGDRLFLERPAFADAQTSAAELRSTPYGDFDINPKPGQIIIPRNYGEGPGFFAVNLGVSRTFGFGELPGASAAAAGGGGGPRGGGGVGGPGGGGQRAAGGGGGGQRGPGGPGAGPGGAGSDKRYNLTFSLNFQNLLNRTNLAPPVGNLNSPFFGESTRTLGGFGQGGNPAAGNRRVTATIRFNF